MGFQVHERIVSTKRLAECAGMELDQLRRLVDMAGRYYMPFDRRKHEEDHKWRHIDNPTGLLQETQRLLNRRYFRKLGWPEVFWGGIRGRSALGNAAVHAGQPVVVRLDIANFYPSINNDRVFACLRRHLGFGTKAANLLTRLTTFQRRLPQGAPTSPAIGNLVLLDLEPALRAIADDFGLELSVFVDDIVVSGLEAERAIPSILGAIGKAGFRAKSEKSQVLRSSYRQEVTGYLVNRSPSLARYRIEAIARRILALGVSGIVTAQDLLSVHGQIERVRSVAPSKAQKLEALAAKHLPSSSETAGGKAQLTRPCSSFRRSHVWRPSL
jgi:RNA-directed DNA polymerase